MSVLFISDLHLEDSRPDITEAFIYFLSEKKAGCEALYILGDFFENWVGDDEQTPLHRIIIDQLRTYTHANIPVFFLHGNRDFLIGLQFSEESGCRLLHEESIVTLYGQPVLLMHGDSLCTNDKGYMNFRKNARNPVWQQAFLTRPLEDRIKVARQLRELSMAQNKGKTEAIMDVTPDEVVTVMEKHQTRYLIHGHTHRPAIHSLDLNQGRGQRIVLGDWDKSGWCLEVSPSASDSEPLFLNLYSFPLAG